MQAKAKEIRLAKVSKDKEKELIDILEKNYNFFVVSDTVERFSETTASSKVYRCQIKEGGQIVIKRSFWYNDEDKKNTQDSAEILEKVYSVSEELRKRGIKLPRIISNKNNKFITTTKSDQIMISEFINGKKFTLADREFFSIGSTLGQLHKTGLQYLKDYPKEYKAIEIGIPVEKPYEESRAMYYKGLREDLLADHQCSAPEVCKTVKQNIKIIDETIEYIDNSDINSKSLSRGILHNDLNRKNIFFNSEGEVISVLDIDQVGVGPLIWDVGNTLASFAWEFHKINSLDIFEQKVKLFLQAYHEASPLPAKEYELCLAANQRWDVMRILRSLRRHHYENDRLPGLLPKIKDRIIPRIIAASRIFFFLTEEWIKLNII